MSVSHDVGLSSIQWTASKRQSRRPPGLRYSGKACCDRPVWAVTTLRAVTVGGSTCRMSFWISVVKHTDPSVGAGEPLQTKLSHAAMPCITFKTIRPPSLSGICRIWLCGTLADTSCSRRVVLLNLVTEILPPPPATFILRLHRQRCAWSHS